MPWRELPRRETIHERLELVFPRQTFDTVMSNPLAAAAVAAMLYIDAVTDDAEPTRGSTWARPTTCLWMSDAAYAREGSTDRARWRDAAARGKKEVCYLLSEWGEVFEPWYADNSRETLRDETFPKWLTYGAIADQPGVKTTSSRPRWALTASFAALFDPDLTDEALEQAIAAWRDGHMAPGERLRIRAARTFSRKDYAVTVTLPQSGQTRSLEPGEASHVLKGVIEQWAPARLGDPHVLTISEPGAKVYIVDEQTLHDVGLTINVSALLPDALLIDLSTAPVTFWIIEAVASDGPVDKDRRQAFRRWANEQHIPPESCRFLSAFTSRNSPAARRRLKDLATGTYAW
jgi:hypothetical protein